MSRSLLAIIWLASGALADPRLDQYGVPLPDGAIVRFGTVKDRIGESNQSKPRNWDFSPDGKTLICETTAGINFFDIDTGRCRATCRVPGYKGSDRLGWSVLRYSPDGKLIVRAAWSGLSVLDATSGRTRAKFDIGDRSGSISFLAGTTRFAAFRDFGQALTVCDARDGTRGETVPLKVPCERISPMGRYALAGPTLVDAKTGEIHREFRTQVEAYRCIYEISPDERFFCELRRDGHLVVFAADSGKLIDDVEADWKDFTKDSVLTLQFAPDSSVVYLTEGLRWDLKARKWLPPVRSMPVDWHLHPDGKRLFRVDDSGLIEQYDLTRQQLIAGPAGFEKLVSADASPNGQMVAISSADAKGDKLDVHDIGGRLLWSWRPREGELYFRWSPDSHIVACTARYGVELRNAKTGAVARKFEMPENVEANAALFSTDGSRLLVSQSRRLENYNVGTGKLIASHVVPDAYSFDVSPDGQVWISPRVGSKFSLFDPSTGRITAEDDRPAWRTTVFSPEGSYVLSSDEDGRVHRQDPMTFAEQRTFEIEESNHRTCFGIEPNGLWFAIGSEDGRVSVWDAECGQCLLRLEGHLSAIKAISFAGPGRAVSSSTDLTALVWELRPKGKPSRPHWDALIGDDALEVYRAIWAIADDPKGPELLRKKIATAKPFDASTLAQRLTDLGSDRYALREQAMKELHSLRRLVEPALKEERTRTRSEEARTRIDTLLAQTSRERSASEILTARAVAAMELSGSEAAKKLLGEWAAGAPGARLTIDAKAALNRLSLSSR